MRKKGRRKELVCTGNEKDVGLEYGNVITIYSLVCAFGDKVKPEQWIIHGEVGTSSKTIWAVMMGVVLESHKHSWDYDVPHDPDDFSRCWKLLTLFPEWQQRLSEVADVFPTWVGFVREWEKLTQMFEENLAKNPGGYSKEMYDLMCKLEDEGRVADGWIQDSPNSWHRNKAKS